MSEVEPARRSDLRLPPRLPPRLPWRELQARFAAAVRAPDLDLPPTLAGHANGPAVRRFNVYRNNHTVSLVDALAATFPVVVMLVGDAFFRATARAFVADHPPRSPVLIHYGGDFATFLATFPPAAGAPYLADVARLEYARLDATHAADADPVAITELATISPDDVGAVTLALHPSVRLLAFDFPAVAIWQLHQGDDPAAGLRDLRPTPEHALVVRPALATHVVPLTADAYAFASALARGATLDVAAAPFADDAPEETPSSNGLATALAMLFSAGAITAVRLPASTDRQDPR